MCLSQVQHKIHGHVEIATIGDKNHSPWFSKVSFTISVPHNIALKGITLRVRKPNRSEEEDQKTAKSELFVPEHDDRVGSTSEAANLDVFFFLDFGHFLVLLET